MNVFDMPFSKVYTLLVEMVLGIAEDLNIPVIAEGVETAEQLQLLKQMGCTIVQEFYFSKPLPAEEFEKKCFQG